MQINNPVWCIGMMSGTSLDGVDAALIRTDGEVIAETGTSISLPYDAAFRAALYAVLQGTGDVPAVTRELTLRHSEAATLLLQKAGLAHRDIALIGFHGQTIWHKPHEGKTCQIGDAALLANEMQIPVVYDFRSNDMAHGGQGAPLVPLYHAALAISQPKPLAVVNIGGVANITWIGRGDEKEPRVAAGEPQSEGVAHVVREGRRNAPFSAEHQLDIIAFDCGMGNALMDDMVLAHTGATYDKDGAIAARGTVDEAVLTTMLAHPFFSAPYPKSLDRLDFTNAIVQGMVLENALATLAAFTVQGIVKGVQLLPEAPGKLMITGGGRHNATLMNMLQNALPTMVVAPVEASGWDGDMLEAQAFGFLAARSVRGLPLSLPTTTGVKQPVTGGKLVLS